MTGSIQFSNQQWLVRSLDKNNNNVMDELKLDPRVKDKVDTDKNGEVSRNELTSALQSDAVEINQGVITESKGIQIYTKGLETLKNVHTTASNSWGHVFTPSFFQDDTLGERYNKLVDSNRAYTSAIDRQESALRSIRDMTANAPDATSRALHIQADTTLRSASWRTWTGTFQNLLAMGNSSDEHTVRQMEMANTNFQAAFETLNNTMRSIADQTKNLPDVQAALKATDNSISKAFSNITQIENASISAQDVGSKLDKLADETQAKATGRTTPYAGVGAGIGAVAGAAIGFFAGGKNIKAAGIGAGVGLAASAGIGALIGSSIDSKYKGAADDLRNLSSEVRSYNPAAEKGKLLDETQKTYGAMLEAREHHDLDNAQVSANNFRSIQSRVAPVEKQSERILGAYKK
jgi:hypothetical protein